MKNRSNNNDKIGSVLIAGSGIGGMQAALDLTAAGIKAYLLDSGPCIGGVMAQLDKTFPTNDCAMCTMAPRLVEISKHKDIEILTLSEVDSIKGNAGNYTVSVKRAPRYVDEAKCNGCGACALACPVGKYKPSDDPKRPQPVPDEYNHGLSYRPAVYIPYPQAIPNIAVIDPKTCLYLLNGKCGVCKKVCKVEAIDFEQKETVHEVKVGAVLLTPGYTLFDAGLKPEYGYGKFKNVLSSLEFERILSASGPYQGKILRPGDKKHPAKLAFIQCVGSRDSEKDYCSSVCCMYATKEAILAKEHQKDIQCDIYFMDLRAFSKGFEEYYNRAKALGVNYIRCRVPEIEEVAGTGNLKVNFVNEKEQKLSAEYDMVMLSAGMCPPKSAERLAGAFGLDLNEHGFCPTPIFAPAETGREGIFAAGTFTEPKDIPESVIQSSGGVARALELLSEVKGQQISEKEFPPEIDVAGQEPRVGVFVCHCGTNIAGVVSVPEVVEYAKTLPNVVYADNLIYACANDSQEKIKKMIKEHKLNRVIVAACTPRTHESLFRTSLREAQLNPYLFEMANVRDQCSWVHMREPKKATAKARDLVRMALGKSRLIEPLQRQKVAILKDVLVIGGGLSGMTSALSLANQGFDVHLVEKETVLGGNLRRLSYLLDQSADPKAHLDKLSGQVKAHKRIRLHTGAAITAMEGFIGNFTTKISAGGKDVEIRHGGIVVATGAEELKPVDYPEYFYGKDPAVLTQLELEEKLASGVKPPKTVAMIQCVGSRETKRPYCSRVCCGDAVKNALKIKKASPETMVYVFYRDIRTYGFREAQYTEARKQGVLFIRYDEDKKPVVSRQDGKLALKFREPISGIDMAVDADLLVLSSAIVPNPGNKDLAQMLKVPLDANGFFLEAHMKLRPVDFANDGIFLCGLAHYPKTVEESVAQANAASARAAAVLSNDLMELEANLSCVIDENCDGCAYCVEPCPYKAVTLIEYMKSGVIKKTVEVNSSLCKGCGACQGTCPKKAVVVKGFKLEQLSAMVDSLLKG